MNVDDVVAARIEAARVRIQAAKRRREELSAARACGLAARHANKLRQLASPPVGLANQPAPETKSVTEPTEENP
ncbi:hypothetical protein OG233_13980 [Streptomyces sp. NBC_01218]|uniref:hypothetical protein n=1 Tax=Streptomyces sp. NBC_01218 TaxID=2903780 RepID=UPI002E0E045C|nr:hypothetical protein OG233_13980 [Streptomyces sp. NBC_01218]